MILVSALAIAWLQGTAHADSPAPAAGQPAHPDPDATPAAPKSAALPWLDLGHPHLSDPADPGDSPHVGHPIAAIGGTIGVYSAFTLWTYYAWYRKHKPLAEFKWGGDGYFGKHEYAGGSDKLGHAWATMGLARGTTEMLVQLGGYDRLASTLIGAGLADLLFLGVEVKDGFYYEFSYGDFLFDSIGAALAVVFSLSPRLDEMFDYRVQYWPSSEYRAQLDGGNVNIAEDYSGEIYMLAFHLGSIHAWSDTTWGSWTRFVDVAAGFGTRGYKPDEPAGTCPPKCYAERQNLYVGVSLNAQGVFDWLFGTKVRSAPAKKIAHGLFEMFNAPFTYVPVKTWSRAGMGVNDGA